MNNNSIYNEELYVNVPRARVNIGCFHDDIMLGYSQLPRESTSSVPELQLKTLQQQRDTVSQYSITIDFTKTLLLLTTPIY